MAKQTQGSVDLTKTIVAFIQIIMTAIAGYVATEIKDMSKSIESLNVQIASLLTEVSNQKQELNKMDSRLFNLETRLRR